MRNGIVTGHTRLVPEVTRALRANQKGDYRNRLLLRRSAASSVIPPDRPTGWREERQTIMMATAMIDPGIWGDEVLETPLVSLYSTVSGEVPRITNSSASIGLVMVHAVRELHDRMHSTLNHMIDEYDSWIVRSNICTVQQWHHVDPWQLYVSHIVTTVVNSIYTAS